MPTFERDGATIYYEEYGEGFPVLLFAPGGMRSSIGAWRGSPFDPIETLKPSFRVIAMDQRNAGRSTAPVRPDDGWHSYTADHLALLDHLGIDKTHVLGGCIGGPYCLGAIEAAPERIASAVLQQTIGLSDNRDAFYAMFDGWAEDMRKLQPDVPEATWSAFRSNMYDGDFVLSVSRDFVRGCSTPLLVLMGNDLYHPQETSREVAALAPHAQLIEQWKEPEVVPQTVERVIGFLKSNTP
jgi:pimeloyl-ACP methyl ester carboxylesterase